MKAAFLLLAAGRSSRFGVENKLLAPLDGLPVIAHAARHAADGFDERIAVTGHERATIEAALTGLSFRVVHNPHYSEGVATSLHAGIAALPPGIDACLVMLGDMPRVLPATVAALRAAASANPRAAAIIPAIKGEWGNPVMLMRPLFEAVAGLSGDQGARKLLVDRDDAVVIETPDPGILADVDTREMLNTLQASKA